jgi:hypothetical protein
MGTWFREYITIIRIAHTFLAFRARKLSHCFLVYYTLLAFSSRARTNTCF